MDEGTCPRRRPWRKRALEIRAGHTILSYEERPDLDPAIDELLAATWPAFMNEDEGANAHFSRAYAGAID